MEKNVSNCFKPLSTKKNLKVQKGTISSEVKIMGPKIIFKMNPQKNVLNGCS